MAFSLVKWSVAKKFLNPRIMSQVPISTFLSTIQIVSIFQTFKLCDSLKSHNLMVLVKLNLLCIYCIEIVVTHRDGIRSLSSKYFARYFNPLESAVVPPNLSNSRSKTSKKIKLFWIIISLFFQEFSFISIRNSLNLLINYFPVI